mmetsp:Transcript_40235/g.104266  ORF Transcript_40235/g.104266 Transcript_40235/m.104266 type:complete len:246 (-) Transcript_40235:2416-3153(-)
MPPHFAIDGMAKIVAQGFFDFLPVVVRSIHVNHFHLGGRRHAFGLGLLLGAWALFFSPLPFLRVPSFERRGRQPTSPFGGLIDQRVGVLTQVFCPLLAIGDAPGAIFDQVNRESPWIVLQSLKNLDLQVVDDQVLEGGDGLLAHGTLSLAARSLKHCHEPSRIKALHVCALRAPNGRLHAHSRNGTLEFHGDFVYLHFRILLFHKLLEANKSLRFVQLDRLGFDLSNQGIFGFRKQPQDDKVVSR